MTDSDAGDPVRPEPTLPTTQRNDPPEKREPEADLIPPQLDTVLRKRGLNPEDPHVKTAIEVSMMAWRGSMPFPPPPILADLERIHPGITGKMVQWTDEQRAHRIRLEKIETEGDEKRKDRSQILGGGVAVLGLCLAAVTAIWGNPWTAAVIAIVSVGGPIAAVMLAMNLGGI